MNEDEITASKFRRLVELRADRDEAKTAYTNAEDAYRSYEAELFAELEESPVKGSRRIDLGGETGVVVFTPRETKFGRIIDLDKAMAYFRARDLAREMTKPQIEKRKLNELVREHLEAGKPLPEGVDWYANRGITISKKGPSA